MFALKRLELNEIAKADIRQAVFNLEVAGAFSALLELGHSHEYPPPSTPGGIMEKTALRGSFHAGYVACLNDLANLAQAQEQQISKPKAKADFGGLDQLLSDKKINQEEYNYLKNSDEEI